MKILILALALLLGAAMLLPFASQSTVVAQITPSQSAASSPSPSSSASQNAASSPSPSSSASLEPSRSPLLDALVQMDIGSETEPIRDWAIAVSGGVPSVDVLSVPDPTYGWVEFAVAMSEATATVELTATLPAGWRLSQGTCTSDDDPVARDVLVAARQLVFEVRPGVSYQCFYGSASDTPKLGAEITAHLMTDADGNRATIDDQEPIEGWKVDLELSDGTIDQAFPMTNSEGLAGWLISYGAGGTQATLSQVIEADLLLLDARCTKVTDSGDEPVGAFDGYSVTFEVEEGEFASYQCSFIYVPSDTLLAEISVWHRIDGDGDLDPFGDRDRAVPWEFEASFGDDVGILVADATTDGDRPASWVISFRSDLTGVVITAIPRDGSRVVNATCIEAESPDGIEIPTTLAGDSLSFAVDGYAPDPYTWPYGYSCTFLSTQSGGAPAPTVPPTDGESNRAPLEPAPWGLVQFGLAALIGGLFVLGSRPWTAWRKERGGTGPRAGVPR
jgi:hypothetical protein